MVSDQNQNDNTQQEPKIIMLLHQQLDDMIKLGNIKSYYAINKTTHYRNYENLDDESGSNGGGLPVVMGYLWARKHQ